MAPAGSGSVRRIGLATPNTQARRDRVSTAIGLPSHRQPSTKVVCLVYERVCHYPNSARVKVVPSSLTAALAMSAASASLRRDWTVAVWVILLRLRAIIHSTPAFMVPVTATTVVGSTIAMPHTATPTSDIASEVS